MVDVINIKSGAKEKYPDDEVVLTTLDTGEQLIRIYDAKYGEKTCVQIGDYRFELEDVPEEFQHVVIELMRKFKQKRAMIKSVLEKTGTDG